MSYQTHRLFLSLIKISVEQFLCQLPFHIFDFKFYQEFYIAFYYKLRKSYQLAYHKLFVDSPVEKALLKHILHIRP